jgi:transposase
MPLKSLESLFPSERRSYLHLVNEAWRQNRRFCVRCRSNKIYRLADKRYRCGKCGYTFHDFTRRWIGELNLTARQWLWIIKLFELEIAPQKLAKEVEVSYPTALKAIYLIRRAIAHFDDEFLSGESVEALSGEPDRPRVFGVKERDGKIIISIARFTLETVFQEPPKFVRQGSVIFTGRFQDYDGLILWRSRPPAGADKAVHKSKPPLDGLDSFWNFARQRLARFHRSSDRELFYFLKELAFRYEHRDKELFEPLVRLMTRLMPQS